MVLRKGSGVRRIRKKWEMRNKKKFENASSTAFEVSLEEDEWHDIDSCYVNIELQRL